MVASVWNMGWLWPWEPIFHPRVITSLFTYGIRNRFTRKYRLNVLYLCYHSLKSQTTIVTKKDAEEHDILGDRKIIETFRKAFKLAFYILVSEAPVPCSIWDGFGRLKPWNDVETSHEYRTEKSSENFFGKTHLDWIQSWGVL